MPRLSKASPEPNQKKVVDNRKHVVYVAPMDGLNQAIKVAGSAAALARSIGITPAAITNWKARGSIPAEKAVMIERATGVSRAKIRPDLWLDSKKP